jgi:hypothetical protein
MLVLKQRALTGQQPQSQMKQLAASNKLLPKTGEPTDATPDPLTSTNKFNLPGIRSRVQRVFLRETNPTEFKQRQIGESSHQKTSTLFSGQQNLQDVSVTRLDVMTSYKI